MPLATVRASDKGMFDSCTVRFQITTKDKSWIVKLANRDYSIG